MPTTKNTEKKIIGREEWCSFPQLHIPAINARVDSGAKTSSIQASEVEIIEKKGEKWARFTVVPLEDNIENKIICEAKLVGQKMIKSSSGIAEERYIIQAELTLGEDTFEIELSLANRNTMKFKMLLGRQAMSGRYLINPGKTHLQRRDI
ncbi:MAG: RimK/LysX family protein [Flavobacteriales bacterium]